MAEPVNASMDPILNWRTLIITAVAMIAASWLSLLLIPQLSLRAAVMGTSIAFVSMVASRVGTVAYLRYRQRRG